MDLTPTLSSLLAQVIPVFILALTISHAINRGPLWSLLTVTWVLVALVVGEVAALVGPSLSAGTAASWLAGVALFAGLLGVLGTAIEIWLILRRRDHELGRP
ncbi:hypothetical protein [Lapillicoccus sp.]|uniref:hypothetical protein n=1 Tax=Lapillicoccus sp. TaxID=1909287 RepID=UPI0025DB1017|nr:hypothetical protein [Lapillicoccus sp.]